MSRKKKVKKSNDRQNIGWNIVVAFTRLVDSHACRARYREKRPSTERERALENRSKFGSRDARVTIVVPETTLHLILISRTYTVLCVTSSPIVYNSESNVETRKEIPIVVSCTVDKI